MDRGARVADAARMRNSVVSGLLVLAIAGCTEAPSVGVDREDLDASAFVLPSLTADQRAQVVQQYDALDPTNLVTRGLLEDAIVYYDANLALIPQPRYFAVVDLSKYSGKNRYWLVDTTTGAVEPHKVAHGAGSDPDNDGYATKFGNVDGSHMSSLGFYLTGEIYDGTHPHSMRLDGLSPDGSPNGMANTNARERDVVMHEATYVCDSNTSQQGRSDGCLALDPAIELGMVDRIHDGTLIYVATSPLNAPVGRAADGSGSGSAGSGDGKADDPNDGAPPQASDGVLGGCAAGGGGGGAPGVLLVLALAGVRYRRRA